MQIEMVASTRSSPTSATQSGTRKTRSHASLVEMIAASIAENTDGQLPFC